MHRAFRMAKTLAGVAALWLVLGSAFAQRVEGDRVESARGLYEAEVKVNGQGQAERSAGFARAMSQVLGKLTGDRSATSRPGVGQELRRADEYVKSYDYRQDEGRSATGAPTFTTTLVVRFDPDQIDAIAATLGLPVWPEPRPKPVLWLAIEHGTRGIGLCQRDQARAATIVDREPQHRLGARFGPHRQAERGGEAVDLFGAEAHDQCGGEGRRAGGGAALVLAVVVALHVFVGAAHFLADAGPAGGAAIAGELAEHLRHGAREAGVAFGRALAVDVHFGLVEAARVGDVALHALRERRAEHEPERDHPRQHFRHAQCPVHRPSLLRDASMVPQGRPSRPTPGSAAC